jgi:hypothetical protein
VDDDGIEKRRRELMAALNAAHTAYRDNAVDAAPLSGSQVPRWSTSELKALIGAIDAAEAELKAFNEEHPRPEPGL